MVHRYYVSKEVRHQECFKRIADEISSLTHEEQIKHLLSLVREHATLKKNMAHGFRWFGSQMVLAVNDIFGGLEKVIQSSSESTLLLKTQVVGMRLILESLHESLLEEYPSYALGEDRKYYKAEFTQEQVDLGEVVSLVAAFYETLSLNGQTIEYDSKTLKAAEEKLNRLLAITTPKSKIAVGLIYLSVALQVGCAAILTLVGYVAAIPTFGVSLLLAAGGRSLWDSAQKDYHRLHLPQVLQSMKDRITDISKVEKGVTQAKITPPSR